MYVVRSTSPEHAERLFTSLILAEEWRAYLQRRGESAEVVLEDVTIGQGRLKLMLAEMRQLLKVATEVADTEDTELIDELSEAWRNLYELEEAFELKGHKR